MNRKMKIMLIVLAVLFGAIFIYKAFKSYMISRYLASMGSQTVTVSTTKVGYQAWDPRIKAVGSLRAVTGVNVTTELAGLVQKIYFKPGTTVTEGAVLVQLNAASELGQLRALEASAQLAKVTYLRDKAQYAVRAVSKQTVDTDEFTYQNYLGQVAQQAATVAKKTIRAPFTGRLGISAINPGQYINAGDKIVSLQTLSPIYIDFFVPQQELTHLKLGQGVVVTSDTFPHKTFNGKITTIEPNVDVSTRNVQVEATLDNAAMLLTPGMFALAEVNVGAAKRYLTLPQTAISFNPFGDMVYIVRRNGKDKEGKETLIAKQVFVTTGETRGDQIAILKGLKEGDVVVTGGQVKLKSGSPVTINNSVQPANSAAPTTVDE